MKKKGHYKRMLARIRKRREELPSNSFVRQALTDQVVESAEATVRATPRRALDVTQWPLIISLFEGCKTSQLTALDDDIAIVTSKCPRRAKHAVGAFLHATQSGALSTWYGSLFEIWAKAAAIRSGLALGIDCQLSNGRDFDILLNLAGRRASLECTVLTEDNISRAQWDQLLAQRACDPHAALTSQIPSGTSLYRNARRVYQKVYDKLAANFDPDQTQFGPEQPGILLLSFFAPGFAVEKPAVVWAMDELFAVQPRYRASTRSSTTSAATIILTNWLDFAANERISRSKLTRADYCSRRDGLIKAPRQLGGILLFDGFQLCGSRVNYNSFAERRVSHSAMAMLERVFAAAPKYAPQKWCR